MRTYDIINAGPRNRFMANGRIVSNSGRTVQPQNFPRPSYGADEVECGIAALKAGALDLMVDSPMQMMSSAIRGVIVAPPGKKLVVSDLSNIEGRVLAWLAGERWKLQAFRDYDNGTGPDLYKLAYAKSFGIKPEQVTKDQRQKGKVQELALGYQGSVGAFSTFATAYGIDLEAMGAEAKGSIPPEVWYQAEMMLEWHIKQGRDPAKQFGLSDDAWLVCESFKALWRTAHPNVTALWGALHEACLNAVDSPSRTFTVNMLKVRVDGAWLRIGLPSGRALCYPQPTVADGKLSYMGLNQYTRKWERLSTYGGKLVENVCQAVARDIIAANMPLIESHGYEIVLTVHDEDITECPDRPEFNHEHLSELLATVPAWAEGMPLAAAGFEGYRYRKD